jgi:hypothetical protein
MPLKMDGTWKISALVFSLLLGYASCALPIFQVVKFTNDVCTGTSRNGTCYTTQECTDLGGTSEGNCAEGFGVCCVFVADCEETISQNNTYLVKAAHTAGNGCNYMICPASTNICRIRFDLTTLTLAMQNTYTHQAAACSATTCGGIGTSESAGKCAIDQFQVVGNAMQSPVICGTAAVGQHMILDVEDENDCLNAIVNVGTADTTTSRQWDIHVTQYLCSDHDVSGPPGCLQYFTAQTGSGTIRDFAMASGTANIGATQTHLQSQYYTICFRREAANCQQCYIPTNTGIIDTATNQGTFGLSVATIAITANAQTGSNCVGDYLEVPGGVWTATAGTIRAVYTGQLGNDAGTAGDSRFCGRSLGTQAGSANQNTATICSLYHPFQVRVHFDDAELAIDAATDSGIVNEFSNSPSGAVGFRMNWIQNCP